MSQVRRQILVVAAALSLSGMAMAQVKPSTADKTIQAIRNSAGFRAATANFDREYDRIVEETIRLTETLPHPSRKRPRPRPIWPC